MPPLLSIQPFLGMPRTIFPLLFILFPLVLYFLWPSWPDLVDSIIAWGREHPLVWTPLIRMYLGHLESLVKTTKPYPQFEEVCLLFSQLLIDTKEEKTAKKKVKALFTTFAKILSSLSYLLPNLTIMFVLSALDPQVTLQERFS